MNISYAHCLLATNIHIGTTSGGGAQESKFPFFNTRGFAPARRGSFGVGSGQALLFRQNGRKPFPPVRGPSGVPTPQPRIIWRRNSLRSDSARQRGRFGAAAPPRPRRVKRGSSTKRAPHPWCGARGRTSSFVQFLGLIYTLAFRIRQATIPAKPVPMTCPH